MAHAVDNVVAFNPARANQRRSVSAESTGVINSCRDIALTRITAALSEAFNKIEDELFALAGKTADRESQNVYLDARKQAREKRSDIEAAFRSEFVRCFEKKVTASGDVAGKKQPAGRYDMEQLSLVEDDTLTESIAVNDIAQRFTNKCDEELRALSQRMGFLLSDPELANDANPIAPDTVVQALKFACNQLTAGFQTKLTVLKMVEQHMAQEMLSVYHDINIHLIAKKILPTIRPTFRKAQTQIVRKGLPGSIAEGQEVSAIGGRSNNAGAAGPADAAGGGFLPTGTMPGNSAAEIFQTLQQLMAGGLIFPVGQLHSQVVQSVAQPGDGGQSAQAMRCSAVNSGLDAAKMGNASNTQGTKNTGVTPDALIAALTQIQHQRNADLQPVSVLQNPQNNAAGEVDAANLSVLREIKAQGVALGSSQVDTMTIDIVALLFDYVFDDKSIPDTIKALIARLQIPVLKVAILDKAFFSKKNHPVRRLLDRLANASVAFAGEASRDDPLYKKIEIIVDRIHGEFNTDIALFDTMIDEFEAFLQEREAANAEVVEKSARAMHAREKREMARMVAQAEIERLPNVTDLPAPVEAMLRGPWARVLERLYLREGGRRARFLEAVETAGQLLWSVEAKINAGQRRDLVAALPVLLRRLQTGLDIAAVEKMDRDRFFSALVDCHAAAVKAGLRGESMAAMFAATNKDEAVAPLFEKLIAEEAARKTAADNISRCGMARIQITSAGVEIEEIRAEKNGGATSLSVVAGEKNRDEGLVGQKTKGTNDGGENGIAADFLMTQSSTRELKRGTWVEFLHEGGNKIRAKLSWVSPLRGVYLFTNPGAMEALSIAPDVLQQQLKNGAAKVLEESSLIDRAVDRMVNSLAVATA